MSRSPTKSKSNAMNVKFLSNGFTTPFGDSSNTTAIGSIVDSIGSIDTLANDELETNPAFMIAKRIFSSKQTGSEFLKHATTRKL